jgi:hypothetical protein
MSLIDPIVIPSTPTIEELTQTLNNSFNKLTTQLNSQKQISDLDVNNHRVTNVGWPTQLHDAVNLEYLKSLKGRNPNTARVTNSANTTSGGYDKATFGVAIDSDLYVANDTNPWYICAATLNLVWVAAVAKNPGDSGMVFRLNKNPADPQDPQTSEAIRVADFGLTPSSLVHTWNDFDITSFVAKDIITIDTLAVGTNTAGGDVVFVLKFEIVDPDAVGTIDDYT